MDPAFLTVAIGAMALSIAAATYYAHAVRRQLPVGRLFDGPGSPMSLFGSFMMLIVIASAGIGRGPVTLLIVIVCGLIANIVLHELTGENMQKLAFMSPVLTFATAWHSGLF
jgi:hypothetical protein